MNTNMNSISNNDDSSNNGTRILSILIDDREKAKDEWVQNNGIFILYDDDDIFKCLNDLNKYIDIDMPVITDRLIDDDDL